MTFLSQGVTEAPPPEKGERSELNNGLSLGCGTESGNRAEAPTAGDTKKGVHSLGGHSKVTLLRFAIDTTSLALFLIRAIGTAQIKRVSPL